MAQPEIAGKMLPVQQILQPGGEVDVAGAAAGCQTAPAVPPVVAAADPDSMERISLVTEGIQVASECQHRILRRQSPAAKLKSAAEGRWELRILHPAGQVDVLQFAVKPVARHGLSLLQQSAERGNSSLQAQLLSGAADLQLPAQRIAKQHRLQLYLRFQRQLQIG